MRLVAARADVAASIVVRARSSPSRSPKPLPPGRGRAAPRAGRWGVRLRVELSIRSSRASTARASSMSTKLAGGSARVCYRCSSLPCSPRIDASMDATKLRGSPWSNVATSARRTTSGRDRRRAAPAAPARALGVSPSRIGATDGRGPETVVPPSSATSDSRTCSAPNGPSWNSEAPSGRGPRRARVVVGEPEARGAAEARARTERVEARRLARPEAWRRSAAPGRTRRGANRDARRAPAPRRPAPRSRGGWP